VISDFLGIRPDAPSGSLSVQDLKVGGGTMAASASHKGSQYTTRVSAPAGWTLTVGQTLPAGAAVKSVTLDGKSAAYEVVDTTRGREVRVKASTAASHTLVVTTP
jgi:hypothetical protein